MKKKLLLLIFPFLILVGCGSEKDISETKVQEEEIETSTQEEKKVLNESSLYKNEESVSEAVENIEYIDGFEKAEYEKFNSYALDNGLGGTAVCIEGKVLNQTKLGDSTPPVLALVVEQDDGKRWSISLFSDSKIEELEEKEVRIFGSYQGFSDVMNLPTVVVAIEDIELLDKARIEVKENGEYKTAWSFMIMRMQKSESKRMKIQLKKVKI